MKLLVTGGAGLLGRELVRQADCEVVATYNSMPIPGGVKLDIRDRAAVEKAIGEIRPDLIIHTAYRQSDWTATADGAANVALAARGVRLVHVSSDAVFSGNGSPYDEDAVPDPITPYGAAKAAAETAVRAIYPQAVVARTTRVGRHVACRHRPPGRFGGAQPPRTRPVDRQTRRSRPEQDPCRLRTVGYSPQQRQHPAASQDHSPRSPRVPQQVAPGWGGPRWRRSGRKGVGRPRRRLRPRRHSRG